jgi:hypothetical protein
MWDADTDSPDFDRGLEDGKAIARALEEGKLW